MEWKIECRLERMSHMFRANTMSVGSRGWTTGWTMRSWTHSQQVTPSRRRPQMPRFSNAAIASAGTTASPKTEVDKVFREIQEKPPCPSRPGHFREPSRSLPVEELRSFPASRASRAAAVRSSCHRAATRMRRLRQHFQVSSSIRRPASKPPARRPNESLQWRDQCH